MPPEDPRDRAGALTVIFRTQSDIEASIVRGLLEAHGIYVNLSSDVPHSVFPLSINGLGEVRVLVPNDHADEAREIIRQQARGGLAAIDAPEPLEARDLSALEDRLGYRFTEPRLLDRALTHRSRANEDLTGAARDNESLEFLGDAVLGFIVADLLFHDFPEFDEGQKSKIKSWLVSTTTLAEQARKVSLGEFLALGRGEEKTGGRNKHALLADGYEAVLAAIYLDGGIEAARAFVRREFDETFEDVRSPEFWGRDYKSALQELVQARNLPLPDYAVAAESGPDHRKVFLVEVRVQGELMGQARGASKKVAEQEAARLAMARLNPEG
ncbi:MAG TPA: ribonuclease III [Vicinamibacterales bacterium]|nr:ribonuclease III [Vicinamibacterales bacterium]